MRGWDWSFLIFVVSFYALPVFAFWDVIVFKLFPPKKFEACLFPISNIGADEMNRRTLPFPSASYSRLIDSNEAGSDTASTGRC